jgi:hypothetical protein
VKARERKTAVSLLNALPKSHELKKLIEEFERKGFLSKREMKVLESLSGKQVRAA